MKTSHGVIQGYNGVAMVDSKHQIVVHAEATGDSEPSILSPMVEKTRENFKEIGKEKNIFKKTKLSGDTGFHSEKNMEYVIENGIDAYIADNKFRHRDSRFAKADRHKERFKAVRIKHRNAAAGHPKHKFDQLKHPSKRTRERVFLKSTFSTGSVEPVEKVILTSHYDYPQGKFTPCRAIRSTHN